MTETQWLPYDMGHVLDDAPIDSFASPSEEASALAAPAYNKLLTIAGGADNPDLQFMRDKHVVLSCEYCSHAIRSLKD